MAEKTEKKSAEKPGEIRMPIEDLKRKLGVKDIVFAGVKALNGWHPGKQVTEKEFTAAVQRFVYGAADGRR